jgi:hypothetical protein
MIKGLAITPPVIGRISIGRVVEKNGKRLPEKDDQFTITTQIQHKDGWLLHPYDELLRQQAAQSNAINTANPTHGSSSSGKLRSIPVRMLFDNPSLNLRAEYSLFDRQTGRPLCVGNGESCKRITDSGVQRLPCPSPSLCDYAAQGHCKPYGRLHVRVEPSGHTQTDTDELGTFIFRTTGFNSIRTLAARLSYFQAYSGGLLSCLPLQLKLRGKSTTQSHRTPIFYVDLCLRDGLSMVDAMQHARQQFDQRQAIGLQQSQLEDAAREGFSNAEFESSLEELPEVLEEFFNPHEDWYDSSVEPAPSFMPKPELEYPSSPAQFAANQTSANSSLKTKLNRQLQQSSRSQQVQPQTRQTSHPTPEKRL